MPANKALERIADGRAALDNNDHEATLDWFWKYGDLLLDIAEAHIKLVNEAGGFLAMASTHKCRDCHGETNLATMLLRITEGCAALKKLEQSK